MADLLPCPFCGGPAELDTRQGYTYVKHGQTRHGTAIAVYCTECSVQISVCREDVPDIAPEAVIEMWSRRQPVPKEAPSEASRGEVWQAMVYAPQDGSEVELLLHHRNWQCAKGEAKKEWEQVVRATWIDFNGGGWTWSGMSGLPMGWRAPATPGTPGGGR